MVNLELNGLPVTPTRNDLSTQYANQYWGGCRTYRCDVCGANSPVLVHGRHLWRWFVRHRCKTPSTQA